MPSDRVYDGVNLLPYLTGQKKTAPHDQLFWRHGSTAAVRKGNWKLFKSEDRYWLFDLSKNVGEAMNLADRYPEIVEQLKKELARWEAQMKQPLWPCRKIEDPLELDGVKLGMCI
jgi:arylsulfatase A-like enzyme